MNQKRQKKSTHPILNGRKCLVSNKVLPKSQLIRIVQMKNGQILIDSNAPGRGAYIDKNCQNLNLIKQKRLLNRVFRTNIDNEIYDNLIALLKGGKDDKR